jgi:HAD superfamily hydrolase (TIGR01509 family)
VHQAITDRLGLDGQQLAAFMASIWREYLGTANTGLIEYARQLRPRYRTGILSNSFVGAREREQATYGFEELVDEIVYSHEAGMSKPDPRIYALICARLDVHPCETAFLDDMGMCVDGAREAGGATRWGERRYVSSCDDSSSCCRRAAPRRLASRRP